MAGKRRGKGYGDERKVWVRDTWRREEGGA